MLKKFTTLWFQGTKLSWCRYFCVVNLRGSNFMPYACKPKDTFTNIGFFLWLIVLRDVRNVCRSILFKNIFAILLILWPLLEKIEIMKTILLDFINNDKYTKIYDSIRIILQCMWTNLYHLLLASNVWKRHIRMYVMRKIFCMEYILKTCFIAVCNLQPYGVSWEKN